MTLQDRVFEVLSWLSTYITAGWGSFAHPSEGYTLLTAEDELKKADDAGDVAAQRKWSAKGKAVVLRAWNAAVAQEKQVALAEGREARLPLKPFGKAARRRDPRTPLQDTDLKREYRRRMQRVTRKARKRGLTGPALGAHLASESRRITRELGGGVIQTNPVPLKKKGNGLGLPPGGGYIGPAEHAPNPYIGPAEIAPMTETPPFDGGPALGPLELDDVPMSILPVGVIPPGTGGIKPEKRAGEWPIPFDGGPVHSGGGVVNCLVPPCPDVGPSPGPVSESGGPVAVLGSLSIGGEEVLMVGAALVAAAAVRSFLF